MRVYRLTRAAHRALDGEGARLWGGRWNSPGRPVVYTSTTLALAALEYLVHVDPGSVPTDLLALTLELPADAPTHEIGPAQLPPDWAQVPDHPVCRQLGDAWLRAATALALVVPSAAVPEERNVLINPLHDLAGKVAVVGERAFGFDPRLVG